MNSIANNAVSKLFVAFVAAAMLFTVAAPAKAATVEELQAQIAALMAQISSLSGTATSASTAACTFTRSLTVGSEGADVKCLQDYLTPTYFSNAGGSTGYFGSVTAAAVSKWQAANGVSAIGIFGPASQAKYSALMAAAPVVTTPDTDSSDDSSDDEDSAELSGEADLNTVEIADGEDADDVEEGSEELAVAEITLEFADGDAIVDRIDIALDGTANTANTEADPWDIFEEVSLSVDGEVVATIDTTDEDNYLDEDNGSLRFSGLDIVAMEDEEVIIEVLATITSSVDNAGSATLADWDVLLGPVRFTDADDVTSTETTGHSQAMDGAYSATDAGEFTIDAAGAGDDLDLESSDEDPDATTFALDEDDNVEEAIFAFELSAEDSEGDIDLNEIVLSATVTTATSIDDLVNDFRIEIGGQSFNAESYTGTAQTLTNLTFDIDGDVTISADEAVTVVVYADFEDMEANDEGSTIAMQVESADIDAEGSDDVTVGGSTSISSEIHTLRTEGVDLAFVDDTVTSKANTDATTTDDEGVFVIEFDVTAFGGDLYIDDTTDQGTVENNYGVNYIVTSNGSTIASTTAAGVATLDSDAELTGGRYKIAEGETETFTLTVEYDPASSGSFKVQLYSVNFNDTNADADTQQLATPAEDFDTASLTI